MGRGHVACKQEHANLCVVVSCCVFCFRVGFVCVWILLFGGGGGCGSHVVYHRDGPFVFFAFALLVIGLLMFGMLLRKFRISPLLLARSAKIVS